jgi:hypothetical protein
MEQPTLITRIEQRLTDVETKSSELKTDSIVTILTEVSRTLPWLDDEKVQLHFTERYNLLIGKLTSSQQNELLKSKERFYTKDMFKRLFNPSPSELEIFKKLSPIALGFHIAKLKDILDLVQDLGLRTTLIQDFDQFKSSLGPEWVVEYSKMFPPTINGGPASRIIAYEHLLTTTAAN